MVQGNMLLVILAISIAAIVLLISKFKVHAFVSLLMVALYMGLVSGMEPVEVVAAITGGFGRICGEIGIIIALGTIIGIFLEKSGAAYTMAGAVLRTVGERRPALAVSIIGYIVSIPVFCDSAFVILSALNKSLVRRTRASMVTMAVALSTGLFATHTLVPPTPGPIAAAGNLYADLGLVILMGAIVAAFAAIAGYVWAVWFCADLPAEVGEGDDLEELIARRGRLPSAFISFAPLLLPIVLIAAGAVTTYPPVAEWLGPDSPAYHIFLFVGHPVIALFLGFLLSLLLLPKFNEETLTNWIGVAIGTAGSIILITASGGAFAAVIAATGVGTQLSDTLLSSYNLGIFLPFALAAALKTAQGSSTVAMITASTITYPLLATLGLDSDMGAVLATLSVGAGSMVVSHANDSYFWVVSQFSGIKVNVAYRSHTVATLIQGVVAIVVIYIMSLILL